MNKYILPKLLISLWILGTILSTFLLLLAIHDKNILQIILYAGMYIEFYGATWISIMLYGKMEIPKEI